MLGPVDAETLPEIHDAQPPRSGISPWRLFLNLDVHSQIRALYLSKRHLAIRGEHCKARLSMMKKALILIVGMSVLFAFVQTVVAGDIPRQGSFSLKVYGTGTWKAISMGEERLHATYETVLESLSTTQGKVSCTKQRVISSGRCMV